MDPKSLNPSPLTPNTPPQTHTLHLIPCVLIYVWRKSLTPEPEGGGVLENNYLTDMCSGSEAGSYLRLTDFCNTVYKMN